MKSFTLCALLAASSLAVRTSTTEYVTLADYDPAVPDSFSTQPVGTYALARWRNKDAATKMETMHNEIWSDTTLDEVDYDMTKLFEVDMGDSMTSRTDEVVGKVKMLHQRGSVAEVNWVSVGDHPFTGMFKQGADYGIFRLSENEIHVDGEAKGNPSAAVKYFVDGEESINLVFLIDFNDQSTANFFPTDDDGTFKPFTNHPAPPPEDGCARKTAARKIREGTGVIFACGNGHMAATTQTGSSVETPVFPFETLLYPNPDVIPEWDGSAAIDQIADIPASGDDWLFEVYANEDPDGEFFKIAEIYSSTPFTHSLFSDERLFFRHEAYNRDFTKLDDQGQTDRSDEWTRWIRNRQGTIFDAWGDTEVTPLPEDEDEMKDTIIDGILGDLDGAEDIACPFAWLFASGVVQ